MPTVGSSAAIPGNGVLVSMTSPAGPIIASPTQPAAVAAGAGSRGEAAGPDRQERADPELPGPRRQREERPRLRWRVVSHSDSANERDAATTASTADPRSRTRPDRGRRRGSTSRSRAGQNR